MSLTWKKAADVSSSTKSKAAKQAQKASSKAAKQARKASSKAAKQARKASSAAAANAANTANTAAQTAALAAQNAAGLASAAAATAAQSASGAAQTAAAGVSKGVKQGVYNARSWAAPRIDTAADYCTTAVAPKVSAALHNTARQVSPADPKRSKRSSMLIWSVLGAAIVAALGAAAAMARYRYRAEISAESEDADDEVLPDSTGSQTAPANPDGTRPASEKHKDQDTETSVNGRVTASGW
jgi:hypothetical protein